MADNNFDREDDGATSPWGCAAGERKEGLLNRVVDRFMNSPTVSALAISTAASATVVGLALAASAGANAYDAHVGASYAPIHVAAFAQGTARPDYGFPNLTVEAMQHSKDNARSVHAAVDSEPSRGAQALSGLIGEMRLSTSSPIVVHAYDPFVKDGAGGSKLDLNGVRQVAPLMAKDGVKVAVMPFAVSNSAAGREMSKIMKDNGIAVFAPAGENGVSSAPDIVTVKGSWNPVEKSSAAHFEAYGRPVSSVGRMAGTGAIYAAINPELRGSAAIGSEMQSRIDHGTQIVVRGGSSASVRRIRSVQASPGIRIPTPVVAQKSVSAAPAMHQAAHAAAMSAGRGG